MMEQINRDNYEVYFLDFIEGNLSEDQISMLNAFLTKNSDLKTELDEFEAITLQEPLETNEQLKASLKREESTALLEQDYLMISQIENTITEEEKAKLSALVSKSPKLLDDLALYHKTIIPKNQSIYFPDKASLMQKEKRVVVWWQYAAAAAILLFAVFNWNTLDKEYAPKSFSFAQLPISDDESSNYAFIPSEERVAAKVESPENQLKEEIQNEIAEVKPILKDEIIPQIQAKEEIALINLPIETEDTSLAKQTNQLPAKQENTAPSAQSREKLTPPQKDLIANANTENGFIPIDEFVRNKVKIEIIKGRTFSETVLEELANKAKDALNLKTEKDEEGETQKFALNIGKFSFSKTR